MLLCFTTYTIDQIWPVSKFKRKTCYINCNISSSKYLQNVSSEKYNTTWRELQYKSNDSIDYLILKKKIVKLKTFPAPMSIFKTFQILILKHQNSGLFMTRGDSDIH